MNGRMYDPFLGRMLSPDNYVQAAGNTQSYNRYSYCLNNPLKFTDPSGQFVHIILGAAIGGLVNVALHAGQIHSLTDFGVAFGIGAVAGAVGAATGGAAFLAAGGGAAGAGGFIAGFAGGAMGSAVSMPIQNVGNHMYFGDPLMSAKQYAMSILGGGLIGGTINGLTAVGNGNTFWNGNPYSATSAPGTTPLPRPAGSTEALSGRVQEPRLQVEKIQPTTLPDEQMPNTIPNNLGEELPASTPVGTRSNYMNSIGNNKASVVNGREFSGHALDQMQGRGILSPSVVEDAIRYPTQVIQGNTPNTAVFIKDNLRVVINSSGKVITVY